MFSLDLPWTDCSHCSCSFLHIDAKNTRSSADPSYHFLYSKYRHEKGESKISCTSQYLSRCTVFKMENIVIFVFKSMFHSIFVLNSLLHSILLVLEERWDMVEQILIFAGFSLMISLIKIQDCVSLK